MKPQSNAGAMVLLAAACQPEVHPLFDLPAPVGVGEHLRFYRDPEGLTECGGTLSYMDRYVDSLLRIHRLPTDVAVDYYWFADDSVPSGICSASTACTFENGTVVTPLIPHEHELVHAVRTNLEGWPGQLFFEEGLAEVWGEHEGYSETARFHPAGEAIEAAVDLDPFPHDYYPTAGSFSAFLISELGSDALVELGAIDAHSGLADLDPLFVDEIGVSLESLVDQYGSMSLLCDRSVFRDDTPSCAVAPELGCADADESGTLSFDFQMSCSSEQFIGPRGGMAWSEVVIVVPENRYVRFLFESDLESGAVVTVRHCGAGCGEGEEPIELKVGVENERLLEVGRYLMRVEIPEDAEERTGVLTIRDVCVQ